MFVGERRNLLCVCLAEASLNCFHAVCGCHWLVKWWMCRWGRWGSDLWLGRRIISQFWARKSSRVSEHSLFQHPTTLWGCYPWQGQLSLFSRGSLSYRNTDIHWREERFKATDAGFTEWSRGEIKCCRRICWMCQRDTGGVAVGKIEWGWWLYYYMLQCLQKHMLRKCFIFCTMVIFRKIDVHLDKTWIIIQRYKYIYIVYMQRDWIWGKRKSFLIYSFNRVCIVYSFICYPQGKFLISKGGCSIRNMCG